jgi:hypothetical protein
MKVITGVQDEDREDLPNWEAENPAFAICKALLKKSQYWEF